MAKAVQKLLNLKAILESAEDDEKKMETEDEGSEKKNETDDSEKKDESEDDDSEKKDESDDEGDKKDEADADWLDEEEEEDGEKSEGAGEDTPGQQTDIDGLNTSGANGQYKSEDDIGKPGPLKNAQEDEEEDSELLMDDEEEEKKEESDEDDEKNDKVEEAAVARLVEALKLTPEQTETFSEVLSSVVTEHAMKVAKKSEKRIRAEIVKEANDRIRLAIGSKRVAVKEIKNEARAKVKAFKEANKAKFERMSQFAEMKVLFKSLSAVMESHGLLQAPDAQKIVKESAKTIKGLKLENQKLKVEAQEHVLKTEALKVAIAVKNITSTMTESETAEFKSLIGDLKVENEQQFLSKALKIRDRLFSKNEKQYDNFVEGFTDNSALLKTDKVVKEEKEVDRKTPPTSMNYIYEAVSEVLGS